MRIGPKEFLIDKHPDYNPLSIKYREYWKERKDDCMNGIWKLNKYMPGRLNFYCNHGHILLNKDSFSKSKIVAKPFLRDIEWEFTYGIEAARGFSGFELDDKYTSIRLVKEISDLKKEDEFANKALIERRLKLLHPSAYNSSGELKEYVDSLENISETKFNPLGKPIYANEAKNFMMIGSRGFGKSFSVGNELILYEWLFTEGCEIVVGAGVSKYSKILLDKVTLTMREMEGGKYYAGKYYPPPFSRKYKGSWQPGGDITDYRKEKIGSSWKESSKNCRIKHRSFSNNPFAANGTRPQVMIFEECGLFNNLEESYNSSVECMMNGEIKFGTAVFLGTGGDMEGGGSLAAQKMFYEPDTYNILDYPDLFENRKGRIAYFVPAYKGLNGFKNKDGTSREQEALEYLLERREKLKRAKSTKPLDDELQNQPLVPSEAFLTNKGNIFPINLLREQLAYVEARDTQHKVSKYGYVDETLKFVEDSSLRPLTDYPISAKSDNSGCLVIHQFPPKDEIPYGMYIAGLDPYRFDSSDSSVSVGALYIYKRFTEFDGDYDKIVAHYIARPSSLKEFHSNCRNIIKYYNAQCLYENEINNFHQYLEMKGEEHLLTDQPDALIRDIIDDSKVRRGKGIHMNPKIKARGEQLVRDWLLQSRGQNSDGTEILNLSYILDVGLLKELIHYNTEDNYDRVIALILTIMLDTHLHKTVVKKQEDLVKRDPFWDRKLFSRNRKLKNI